MQLSDYRSNTPLAAVSVLHLDGHVDDEGDVIVTPVRVQRRRTKGWRMPDSTIYVGRPTKWGNPFAVGSMKNPLGIKVVDLRHAFVLYRSLASDNPKLVAAAQAELRGRNLACWCPVEVYVMDGHCHADVLLEIANEREASA